MQRLVSGDLAYVVEPSWAQLPPGWELGDVAGVAVDAADQVYVFHRGAHPVVVFSRDGQFLRSWGEDIFTRPHGIHVGGDGFVYCTDDGDHSVRKCTPEGKVLLQLGVPGSAAQPMSGRPFNRCTHTALSPSGDIYVSDGYGNACIHKFSPDGKHLLSWGKPGIGPGEFNIPHNICCDSEGWVYVADRESHRIQVFDGAGRYQAEIRGIHRPCAMCLHKGRLFVGEVGPGLPINRLVPNLGPRISVLTADGGLVARLGEGAGEGDAQFLAPHGIAVDSRGDIYVGEVASAAWSEIYPERERPSRIRTFRKLTRVAGQLE